jgi:hypothetical protein
LSHHGKSRSRQNRDRRPSKPPIEFPRCPICQKAVRDLTSAITHKESGQPAHFDCILRALRSDNAVQQHEKICYLGKGSFGIVQFREHSGRPSFFIRKRIQYEDPEPVPQWRQKPAINPSAT